MSWDSPLGVLNPDLQELVHSCLRPNYEERPTAREVKCWLEEHGQRIARSSFGSGSLDHKDEQAVLQR